MDEEQLYVVFNDQTGNHLNRDGTMTTHQDEADAFTMPALIAFLENLAIERGQNSGMRGFIPVDIVREFADPIL